MSETYLAQSPIVLPFYTNKKRQRNQPIIYTVGPQLGPTVVVPQNVQQQKKDMEAKIEEERKQYINYINQCKSNLDNEHKQLKQLTEQKQKIEQEQHAKINQLNNEISKLNREINQIKNSSEQKVKDEEIQVDFIKLQEQTQKIQTQEVQVNTMQNEIEKTKQRIETLAKNYAILENELKEKEARWKKDITDVQTEKKTCDEKLEIANNKNTELQTKQVELEKNEKKYQSEIANVKQQIKDKQNEIALVEVERNKCLEQLKKAQETECKGNKSIEQVENLKRDITKLDNEKAVLNKQLNELKNELEVEHKKNEETKNRAVLLEQEAGVLRRTMDEKQKELKMCNDKEIACKKDLKEITDKFNKTNTDYAGILASNTKLILKSDELENEIKKLNEQLLFAKKQERAAREQNAQYRNTIEDKNNELMKYKNKLIELTKSLERQNIAKRRYINYYGVSKTVDRTIANIKATLTSLTGSAVGDVSTPLKEVNAWFIKHFDVTQLYGMDVETVNDLVIKTNALLDVFNKSTPKTATRIKDMIIFIYELCNILFLLFSLTDDIQQYLPPTPSDLINPFSQEEKKVK